MKSGTKMVLAVGIGTGYVLGRTKKMKLAMALAGGGLGSRMREARGDLIQQAMSSVGESADIEKITESVRGDLAKAVRSAAVTAAASRIDALSDRLSSQRPNDDESDEEQPPVEGRATKANAEPEDDYDEDDDVESGEGEDEEPEADEAPVQRKKPVPRRRTANDETSERPRPRKRAAGGSAQRTQRSTTSASSRRRGGDAR